MIYPIIENIEKLTSLNNINTNTNTNTTTTTTTSDNNSNSNETKKTQCYEIIEVLDQLEIEIELKIKQN